MQLQRQASAIYASLQWNEFKNSYIDKIQYVKN